jgi:hypothetical protein
MKDNRGFQGVIEVKIPDIIQDALDEIEANRKHSNKVISKIFTDNIPGLRVPKVLDKADPCWFGTPFICEEERLKHKLVDYLESNKIQTRNYFAGNILLHPGYSFLDDYKQYPEANKVLDKVFFIGAAPHYTEPVFEYIQDVVAVASPPVVATQPDDEAETREKAVVRLRNSGATWSQIGEQFGIAESTARAIFARETQAE